MGDHIVPDGDFPFIAIFLMVPYRFHPLCLVCYPSLESLSFSLFRYSVTYKEALTDLQENVHFNHIGL